jgi:phenylalanine-4-hydroxylase
VRAMRRDRQTLQILTLRPCQITHGDELLYDPAWGDCDVAIGESVTSVFAGPADRHGFGETDDFVAKRVPSRIDSVDAKRRYQYYARIRTCRTQHSTEEWRRLANEYLFDAATPWLMGMELLEIGYALGEQSNPLFLSVKEKLSPDHFKESDVRQTVEDGLRLAHPKERLH